MTQTFKNKIALVVDDSPTIRGLVVKSLQEWGMKTLEATQGVEALALLASEDVAIVFTDLMMPKMDGFELCGEIRLQEKNRSLPLVVMTTHCDARYVVKALRMGADDFITKPLKPGMINKVVGRLCLSLSGGSHE